MKKYLPKYNTIQSLFYIATLVIVVNFIFWNSTVSESGEKDLQLTTESLTEIIDRGACFGRAIDFEGAENSLSFASSRITKNNQGSYSLGKTRTSDLFIEPICHIFTSINAP